MSIKLFFQAITKYLLGVLIVGLLLFIPANSFSFYEAWLFMGLLFIPMFLGGIILMIKNPTLLKRRLDVKEKENEQKEVILLSGIMFILGFIIAGLNFRYKWILLPNIISIIASIIFIISYILYAIILYQNTYLTRTIKVEDEQKIVDTGLYKVVRHPMYAITLIMFLVIPLILGSIISFIIFLSYPLIIAKRIKNEEEVLEKDLKGYSEYKKKVKYKMIPYIW